METTLIPKTLYAHAYPFVRSVYWEDDEGGPVWSLAWRPGTVWREPDPHIAHGVGRQLLYLVDIYTPPRITRHSYLPRAIYTRQWESPEGRVFGDGMLRWCRVGKFEAITQGFRFPYVVDPDHARGYVEALRDGPPGTPLTRVSHRPHPGWVSSR
jgi:hypothetical protein